ncbi:MAG TPA: type II secretion system protein, partial [Nocardioidaceae bacterium]
MSSRSNPKGGLRARRGDAGFTMIEVLVALTILATMAASMIPVLVTGIRASQKARLETQAKNITQQRIEAMRGLPFHVDRQNGPFLDLLDVYYTDLSTATTTRAIGGETSKANWISNAPGTGGLPSGPAYHVSYPSIPGYPSFTQDVYTQFLRTTHTLATVPAGYTSQVVGSDDPPALLFGVTVITSWTSGQSARSYRTYTEIADGRTSVALITTQAHSVFLRAVSTAADGTTYEGHVGDVQADGSLTSGSLANVQAASGYFELTNQPRVAGAIGSAVAPPNPAGSAASFVSPQVKASGSGPCGWGSLGKTQYDDVSADTAQGWPSAPSDAGTDATS